VIFGFKINHLATLDSKTTRFVTKNALTQRRKNGSNKKINISIFACQALKEIDHYCWKDQFFPCAPVN
jgi:hypothetical protein